VATPSAKPVTAIKPVTRPVTKPLTETKPSAKRATKPAVDAQPAPKPVTQPAPKTVSTNAQPAPKPVLANAQTAPKPVADAHPAPQMPAVAQKAREQLSSSIKQGQQLSVIVVQTWVKAISALPVIDLRTMPGFPSAPEVGDATNYAFDVAADLLSAQRDFAMQLTSVLVPTKKA
jgi:outer membrane biosynthesis protein TonB